MLISSDINYFKCLYLLLRAKPVDRLLVLWLRNWQEVRLLWISEYIQNLTTSPAYHLTPAWSKPSNGSYLENCSSLWTGLPTSVLPPPQSVLHVAVRRSLKSSECDHCHASAQNPAIPFYPVEKQKPLQWPKGPLWPGTLLTPTFFWSPGSCCVGLLAWLRQARSAVASRSLPALLPLSGMLSPQVCVISWSCSNGSFSKKFTLTLSSHVDLDLDLSYRAAPPFLFP